VGIIDTGVDYMHPALGGCFGENCRVAYGYDFVGDDYNGENTPNPDNDPRDTCNGHGTHVTGIIGARDTTLHFTGIAPDGKLTRYCTKKKVGWLLMFFLQKLLLVLIESLVALEAARMM
jgi:subtilisin family serine protease